MKTLVSRNFIPHFMRISWDLGYVYESCRKVTQHDAEIKVKGKNFILYVLKNTIPLTLALSKRYEEIKKISEEIEQWIKKFDEEYELESKEKTKMFITLEDATKLEKQSSTWYETITNEFKEPSTELIDLDKLGIEVNKLSKMVGPIARKDLSDAYGCIGNGLPTPAVMIMNRVGEHMVKKFYKKIMKKEPPENSNWGDLEAALKKELGEKDHLIGLLQFRRNKRNTAQHPGERYTQKQSELAFFQIQELIEEIHRRLKKTKK